MKGSKRKTGLIFGVILATIIMVSSATAVPQVNSDTLLDYLDKETQEDELDLEEFVGYCADLFGVVIDSEEGQYLNIGSEVNYYSVSSEEVLDFLKVFFQNEIVFNYWMSDEFNSLALSIRSMITDINNPEQVANDIVTIIDSPEFDELKDDMQTLLESEEFEAFEFLQWLEDLLYELASLTALVLLILLFPIEWLGYNPLTQIIVFPIAAILAIPMAIVLGIVAGAMETFVLFIDMFQDFTDDLYNYLQSIPDETAHGFKILFAFIVIPIGTVIYAIYCLFLFMPIVTILDILCFGGEILFYLDEYWQELMDELLPGLDLTSTMQTQPVSQPSTPSNPTNI